MPFYKGETGSQIYYDETNLMWVLKNEPDNGVIGNASANLDSMGTGEITWNFNRDICEKRTHKALMTSCKKNQFTCHNDGKCIKMSERCDHFPNCDDYSDEADCHLVLTPENY